VVVVRLFTIPRHPRVAAFSAAALYGIHGTVFQTAAWACVAQELFCILFSALALRAWITTIASHAQSAKQWRAWPVPLFYALALFSKEGAVVLPVIGALFLIPSRPKSMSKGPTLVAAAACVAVAIVYLVIRSRLVTPPPPGSPYEPVLGWNLLRNGLCLGAFMLNASREVLRTAVQDQAVPATLLGALCVGLQAVAVALMLRARTPYQERTGLWVLPVWTIVAIAPYLLPAWNCYPYYAMLGMLPYAVLTARGAGDMRRFWVPAVLACASSLLFQAIEFRASYPATIARARWARVELQKVAAMPGLIGTGHDRPLYLVAEDYNRCAAMGAVSGVAMALGVDRRDVVLIENDTDLSAAKRDIPVLIVSATGASATTVGAFLQSREGGP
jgi:hypothetical protein